MVRPTSETEDAERAMPPIDSATAALEHRRLAPRRLTAVGGANDDDDGMPVAPGSWRPPASAVQPRRAAPVSFTGATWVLRGADPHKVELLAGRLGIAAPLARCMVMRGATDVPSAMRFLNPTLEALHDPYRMHGMELAVERLRRATRDAESIRVVTDYDVDGTTSSLILQGTLRLLGNARVSYHIPHRFEEGYGFSVQAAEAAAADGVQLIVTADIGVKDHAAVTRARELGVDVVIVDHHLPPGEDVPRDANVVLCPPQKACRYPNKALAACGVSLKLAQALLAEHPQRAAILESMLKMAAIGTVADVVDLLDGENRAIVALGLRALNQTRHSPGLEALLRVAGTAPGHITAYDLGFRVGPRVNAAGRVASATAVVELLTARDPARAEQLAVELDAMNKERQAIQDRMLRLAASQVPDTLPPFLVVWGKEEDGWHRGVAGIVASRLRDRHNRPTAVIACGPDGATGSVRSIPEVHAVEALERVADLLDRFGGHPAAAGLSLPTENLNELRERIAQVSWEMLGRRTPELKRQVDLVIESRFLDRRLHDDLALLGPHGKGNQRPRLCVRDARLVGLRILKERHLKARLAVGPDQPPLEVIWWNGAQHADALSCGRAVQLLGCLELNVWRGQATLQLNVEDARFAPPAAAAERRAP